MVGKLCDCSRCCMQVVLIQLETGRLLCKPKGLLCPEQEQKVFHGSSGFFLLSCFTLKQKGSVARVTWTEGTFFKKQRTWGKFELKSASLLFCHSDKPSQLTAFQLLFCLCHWNLSRYTLGFENFHWSCSFWLVSQAYLSRPWWESQMTA